MDAEAGPGAARPDFLAGGGGMGARMRAHDWSASPLGPPERWAQPLKTLVGVMLGSNQPMFVAWGPGRTMLYNDSYAEVLGLKHPGALGRPFDRVWSEIWGELEPIMARCYAGEPIQMDDITLIMHRHGRPEETHFAFSYTPVRDEAGRVAGVFCPCTEITGKVLADRRQAFRLALEDRLRDLSDPREVMAAAAEALGRHLDAAQVGYAEVDTGGHATTGGEFHDGRIPGFRAGRYRLEDYGAAMAADMAAGRVVAVHDVREDARTSSPGALAAYAAISLRAFVIVPLVKGGRLTAYLYAAHPQPRPWSDEDLALLREVAERTWAAVGRARAEAALRESEARFRLMADAVPQIVWITDAEGRAEFFNRQWSDYTGVPYAPTTAAEVAAAFVHPDDAAPAMERFAEARRTGGTFIVEHRIRSKDGGYRWFLVRGEPFRDPRTGGIVRWYGASVDIHDRKSAEAALREREERLRLVVEHARDYAILTTDPQGRIDAWMPGAADVFGWSAEEAVGRPAAMTFTPEDREAGAPEAEIETARREEAAPDVRWHLRKDGSRVFIEGSVTALRGPDGAVRGFLKIGQDVTERRRAEETNARLAAIVASTTDAIIAFAAEDGRILSWNRGAEELFGYTEAEALGGPVGLLVPPDLPEDDPTGVFRRAMDGARVHEHETARVAKSGERIPVSVTASRMLAPGGRAIGVAAIFRDLRQRKAVEERQALLAREVDHRAKNALAVVQTMLRLTRAEDVPSFARAVEGRVAALARAQTLLAEERWNGAALHAMLRGELAPFLGGQRADLDGPPVVLPPGTAQPLAMAVHELATNAAKHGALSVPGGRVSVFWRFGSGAAGVLRLRWAEAGGPPVAGPPARRGFGSRVLDGTVRGQLGGEVSLSWERAGLVCEVEVPLARAGFNRGAADGASAAD